MQIHVQARMHARTPAHKQTDPDAHTGSEETFGKLSKNVYYNIMDWYILGYTIGYTVFFIYRAYVFRKV